MQANERTDERVAQYFRLDSYLFQTTVLRWSGDWYTLEVAYIYQEVVNAMSELVNVSPEVMNVIAAKMNVLPYNVWQVIDYHAKNDECHDRGVEFCTISRECHARTRGCQAGNNEYLHGDVGEYHTGNR